MNSGINIPDEVGETFNKLKFKRAYRYMIFKVTEDKSGVEIEATGERDATFEQFKEAMPKDNAR